MSQANDGAIVTGFRGKRVLIVGGLGFLGSNLACELVALGSRVTIVDALVENTGGNVANIAGIEDDVAVHQLDVRDADRFDELAAGQEIVFNLAGHTSHLDSMTDPMFDLELNCTSQLAILDACRARCPAARLVFAGTRQVYGRPQYLPVDEAHPVLPVDLNGAHKLAAEHYHLVYAHAYGLSVAIVRLGNTYGPRMRVRDDRQTFLGTWLRLVIEGEPVTVFGDGSQLRDLTYATDAVAALLLAGVHHDAAGEIFNLGTGSPISLLELARMLVRVNDAGSVEVVPFPAPRRAIDIGDYFADSSKIRRQLGWEPTVSLEDGLRLSLEFLRAHPAVYDLHPG